MGEEGAKMRLVLPTEQLLRCRWTECRLVFKIFGNEMTGVRL